MAIVVMLSMAFLFYGMLDVVMLSITMLNVIMLSVIMVSVVCHFQRISLSYILYSQNTFHSSIRAK
jgi:hypothetical protein